MAVASNDLFINLIQNNPIVYDKKSKDFKNTLKKERVWNKIAQESFMTVENAKKRYASLRQKYSREKNNIEIRRRLKQPHTRSWIYYERLSFLNPYIQSRTTYTNDVDFKFGSHDHENDDCLNDFDTFPDKVFARETNQDEEVSRETIEDEEVPSGTIEDEEVPRGTIEDEELHRETNEDVIDFDVDNNFPTVFLSEYSGEIVEFHPFNENIQYSNLNEEIITDSEILGESVEGEVAKTTLQQNDYGSGVGTSSIEKAVGANVNIALLQEASTRNDTPRMLNFPRVSNGPSNIVVPATPSATYSTLPSESRPALPPPSRPASTSTSRPAPTSTSRPAPTSASRPALTSASRPAPTSVSRPAPTSVSRPAPTSTSRQTPSSAPRNLPHNTTASATSSKDQTAIDVIRNKMDSCLQAISTKVTEKSNRSPHAPFLAYLDTKLALVPKGHLPQLEKEILNLTETYQQ